MQRVVCSFGVALAIAIIGSVQAHASPAMNRADDAPEPDPVRRAAPDRVQRAPEPDLGSREFADAPAPEAAGGVEIEREGDRPWWLWPGRVLLFIPRWAVEVPFAPPRLGLWAYERYQLRARYIRIFFNDTETVGLFPTLFFETGFGLNAGVRFLHRDLFGTGGQLRMRAGFGGLDRQVYAGEMRTGSRFGRLELKAKARYKISPKSRFFGIGSSDLASAPAMPIDPQTDDTAIDTRYRSSGGQLKLAMIGNLSRELSIAFTATVEARRFEDANQDESINISEAYDPDQLVGFTDGLSHFYNELDITYDSRRSPRPYLSTATPATGWRLSGFVGHQAGFSDDPSTFFRWGADLQRNINIYGGDRYLVLRILVDSIAGKLDRIPFVDLPALGGPLILRGYDRDRFRDRHAALATIEYNYPLMRHWSAHVFVDAGNVWRRVDEISAADARVGYGIGVQVNTLHHFLGRAFVASSIDGGLFVNIAFDPVFTARSRKDRP